METATGPVYDRDSHHKLLEDLPVLDGLRQQLAPELPDFKDDLLMSRIVARGLLKNKSLDQVTVEDMHQAREPRRLRLGWLIQDCGHKSTRLLEALRHHLHHMIDLFPEENLRGRLEKRMTLVREAVCNIFDRDQHVRPILDDTGKTKMDRSAYKKIFLHDMDQLVKDFRDASSMDSLMTVADQVMDGSALQISLAEYFQFNARAQHALAELSLIVLGSEILLRKVCNFESSLKLEDIDHLAGMSLNNVRYDLEMADRLVTSASFARVSGAPGLLLD